MDTPGNRDPARFDSVLRLAARIESRLRCLDEPRAAVFLNDWPRDRRHRVTQSTFSLPVLSYLPHFAADQQALDRDLVGELCSAARSLAWRQTYPETQVGEHFMRNYAWAEVIGRSGPLVGEYVACGFLILGPATRYPSHRHRAEELYVPLSGAADWQQGDGCWRLRQPGCAIHHAPDEPHAMHTGMQPLLALYAWRGDMRPSRLADVAAP